jgi:Domain of unknown function (DUF4157)
MRPSQIPVISANSAALARPGLVADPAPDATQRALNDRSPGRPLDDGLQAALGRETDANFSDVRVHADPSAATLAGALGADAFTRGGDIYFGSGKYSPDTTEGRRLLRHELGHVAQQGRGEVSEFAGRPVPHEHPSERQAASGTALRPGGRRSPQHPPSIQRQPATDPAPGSLIASGPEPRVPIAHGPERRVPIAHGPERRVPIAYGGSGETRYNLPFTIGGTPVVYPNLTEAEAITALVEIRKDLSDALSAGRDARLELEQLRKDHRTVSFWSELLGHASLPDVERWNEVGAGALWRARAILDDIARDRLRPSAVRSLSPGGPIPVERVVAELQEAADRLQWLHNRLQAYRGDVEVGGAESIKIIHVTIDLMSFAAGAEAGRGASLAVKVGRAALTTGSLEAFAETAVEVGEMRSGTRRWGDFDYGKIGTAGLTNAAAAAAGTVLEAKVLAWTGRLTSFLKSQGRSTLIALMVGTERAGVLPRYPSGPSIALVERGGESSVVGRALAEEGAAPITRAAEEASVSPAASQTARLESGAAAKAAAPAVETGIGPAARRTVATAAVAPAVHRASEPVAAGVAQATQRAATASSTVARLSLGTVQGLKPAEHAILNRLGEDAWARVLAYARTNRNVYSIKGKIAEELFALTPEFDAARQRAIALAERRGFPAETVRFVRNVRGVAPTPGGGGSPQELTDGVFAAVERTRVLILTVFESKSPSNLRELGKRPGEFLGQLGWDFERLSEAPLEIDGQTFQPDQVMVSRRATEWIGVAPPGKALSSAKLASIRRGFPGFNLAHGAVSDDALNTIAARVLGLMP